MADGASAMCEIAQGCLGAEVDVAIHAMDGVLTIEDRTDLLRIPDRRVALEAPEAHFEELPDGFGSGNPGLTGPSVERNKERWRKVDRYFLLGLCRRASRCFSHGP